MLCQEYSLRYRWLFWKPPGANFLGSIPHKLPGSAQNIASDIGSYFGTLEPIFWAMFRAGHTIFPSNMQGVQANFQPNWQPNWRGCHPISEGMLVRTKTIGCGEIWPHVIHPAPLCGLPQEAFWGPGEGVRIRAKYRGFLGVESFSGQESG